ncbi:MAG: Fe-S cluster assembly ATPase SufC [Bacilli bacterium]|nr:Fe-S cluster assembly ATPase SufC [Bacilli bacterium]
MLKIKDLSVEINNKVILKDFNIEINKNEIHGIMGPNGIGKSTICKTIMGDPNYKIIKGSITYKTHDLLSLDITKRAKLGIFLVNQTPIEIPGVTNAEMLRIALTEKTGKHIGLFEFNKRLEEICEKLSIPKSFIHRGINEGMSGGERKKNELIHLWMLEPKLIILDELDSGLDVDSLKIVYQNILEYQKMHKASILIITHHAKLLAELNAKYIHILNEGKIIKQGSLELAKEIEKTGFKNLIKTNIIRENTNYE